MVFYPGGTGICPHCRISNKFEICENNFSHDVNQFLLKDKFKFDNSEGDSSYEKLAINLCRCSNCGRNILFINDNMIYPLGSSRPPCPQEVPSDLSEDYKEACLVEPISKKAAAALARRCLQNLLHENNIEKANLSEEIDEAMENLPSYLSDAIDGIRNIGNFSTHPIKSTDTGKIIEVEEGETEWTINVLENLFDFYYVLPKKTEEKREALNKKLRDAGKPEMK